MCSNYTSLGDRLVKWKQFSNNYNQVRPVVDHKINWMELSASSFLFSIEKEINIL